MAEHLTTSDGADDAMSEMARTLNGRRRDLRRLVDCVGLSMGEAGPLIDRLVRGLLIERHPDLVRVLAARGLPPTWEGVAAAATESARLPDEVATARTLDDVLFTATVVALALRWN
jgi:hypothetical protein